MRPIVGDDRPGRRQGDAGIHTAAPGCVIARGAVALSRVMTGNPTFGVFLVR